MELLNWHVGSMFIGGHDLIVVPSFSFPSFLCQLHNPFFSLQLTCLSNSSPCFRTHAWSLLLVGGRGRQEGEEGVYSHVWGAREKGRGGVGSHDRDRGEKGEPVASIDDFKLQLGLEDLIKYLKLLPHPSWLGNEMGSEQTFKFDGEVI